MCDYMYLIFLTITILRALLLHPIVSLFNNKAFNLFRSATIPL